MEKNKTQESINELKKLQDKEERVHSDDGIAIEVKDLSITYKSIKAYSIKKSLLKLK